MSKPTPIGLRKKLLLRMIRVFPSESDTVTLPCITKNSITTFSASKDKLSPAEISYHAQILSLKSISRGTLSLWLSFGITVKCKVRYISQVYGYIRK